MTILDKEYKLYLRSDIVASYIDIENSKTQIVETICVNIIKYEEEFNKIAYDFLISKYNYLLIYNNNDLKYKYYKNKSKDSIFMDLFFNKNYKMIAIFKRKDKINLNSNLRDNLIYINSYGE